MNTPALSDEDWQAIADEADVVIWSRIKHAVNNRLAALTAAPSAQVEPSATPATREGCDYIAPLGSLCRKCGHVHGQRYTFWTGDGEAAMQPDPNGKWLWIGDPAKAPKGL